MKKNKLEIAATMGDPCSIGPQVLADALQAVDWASNIQIHIVGSRSALSHYLPREIISIEKIKIHDLDPNAKFVPGKGDQFSGKRALDDLKFAVKLVEEKQLPALVTGPVDKYLCSLTEPDFRGQTEYIKKLNGAENVTMLLAGPHLRVALVTTHLALRDVPNQLSSEKIVTTAENLYSYLKSFNPEPSLAVCALNPHASDNGLLGDEEERIIRPAVRQLQKRGMKIEGPFPADSLFHRSDEYEGILCMYHDQGLIPLKMQDFYEAVNISLGLSFLRLSVDHGTAFDLVGSEDVSSLSYQRALEQAMAWAERTRQAD